jgi:tRNA nucleotidyltransferase/poly(A) polymerase
MKTHDPERQRQFALDVVQQLRGANFDALWAGGCVRDQLLGIVPKDYDVATNATPDQIRELFGRRRTIPVGAAFGVVTVLGPRRAGQIEVATFRTDATYSDGRHPDYVTFTTAEDDARRRDFTINGLFFDPLVHEVIDYVGGQDDLAAGVVRAIGDPAARLAEDKLRMLRAVRFAATFGFRIEPITLAAIQSAASGINDVSAERIGMELSRMLLDPNRARGLELLGESQLLAEVLPEVAALGLEQLAATQRRLGALQGATLATALAALLLRSDDTNVVATVGRRLRFTNKDIERAGWLLTNLPTIAASHETPWPRLQRVLVHPGAKELLALYEAVHGNDVALQRCRERLALPAAKLNPRPLLDGSDLIAHGLDPGPGFAVLLEKIRDAQLEGQVSTPAEALALVDLLIEDGP